MEEQIADARDNGPKNITSWFERVAATRHSLATLLGVPRDDDIALTRSTTHAILSLANALPWRPGDNVVITDLEFPANVYPWLSLAWREVETRVVTHQPDGRVTADDLAAAIDRHTRVLAVSWVAFANGFRHDLARLSQLCADRRVLLFVDIIQGAGALPLDLGSLGVHMAAGGSHKWLLGPNGSGYLYCSRDTVAGMTPAAVGWLSVDNPFDFTNPHLGRLRRDARRFEESAPSVAPALGTGAAVDLLLEVGIQEVAASIETLTGHLVEEAQRAGLRVVSPRGSQEWSGIVIIEKESPEAAVAALREEEIVAVPRGAGVRIAPHAYNTTAELDRAVEVLRRFP
jgi:selenocysteine lyase/cysteine desulfurase